MTEESRRRQGRAGIRTCRDACSVSPTAGGGLGREMRADGVATGKPALGLGSDKRGGWFVVRQTPQFCLRFSRSFPACSERWEWSRAPQNFAFTFVTIYFSRPYLGAADRLSLFCRVCNLWSWEFWGGAGFVPCSLFIPSNR